jgi:hypothetical protein
MVINGDGISYDILKSLGIPRNGIYEYFNVYKKVLGNKPIFTPHLQKVSLTSILNPKKCETLFV